MFIDYEKRLREQAEALGVNPSQIKADLRFVGSAFVGPEDKRIAAMRLFVAAQLGLTPSVPAEVVKLLEK